MGGSTVGFKHRKLLTLFIGVDSKGLMIVFDWVDSGLSGEPTSYSVWNILPPIPPSCEDSISSWYDRAASSDSLSN